MEAYLGISILVPDYSEILFEILRPQYGLSPVIIKKGCYHTLPAAAVIFFTSAKVEKVLKIIEEFFILYGHLAIITWY